MVGIKWRMGKVEMPVLYMLFSMMWMWPNACVSGPWPFPVEPKNGAIGADVLDYITTAPIQIIGEVMSVTFEGPRIAKSGQEGLVVHELQVVEVILVEWGRLSDAIGIGDTMYFVEPRLSYEARVAKFKGNGYSSTYVGERYLFCDWSWYPINPGYDDVINQLRLKARRMYLVENGHVNYLACFNPCKSDIDRGQRIAIQVLREHAKEVEIDYIEYQ